MSINNQIDILIENNKKLKPVNMTTFNNPFLMLSETTALNNLVSNTRPSTRAETEGIEKPRDDSRRRRSSSPNRRRRSGTSAPYGEPYDSHTLGHGSTIYEPLGIGTETSGTNASIQLGLPVTMRGAISVTASNLGNIRVADGSAFSTVTGIFIDMYGQQQVMFNATVASGLAATRACRLIADNSLAPRIIFTSEL